MNILVLGGGYIGTNISRHLSQIHNVTLLNRHSFDYHVQDNMNELLKNCGAQLVFGAFGFTGKPNVDQAETLKVKCWELNVSVPLMINTVCADQKIPYVHFSSGCIFNGYAREWSDADSPNFGMFDHSSFYSKTKHAFELASKHLPGLVLRIRMPFSGCCSPRNYLSKMIGYDRLINLVNSKTCVHDMSEVVSKLIKSGNACQLSGRKTIHVVNPNPLNTGEVIDIIEKHFKLTPIKTFVSEESLKLTAPRSNCIISSSNCDEMDVMRDERDAMAECVKIMAGSR
jgi:dTDP-4-dehydrorhamnose reductase